MRVEAYMPELPADKIAVRITAFIKLADIARPARLNTRVKGLAPISCISFLSSSGLRSLLMIRREINAHQGILMLIALLPHVEEVFTMTGFSQVFELYPSVEAARAALAGRGETV